MVRPKFPNGSSRIRVPVAAKVAFVMAGVAGAVFESYTTGSIACTSNTPDLVANRNLTESDEYQYIY